MLIQKCPGVLPALSHLHLERYRIRFEVDEPPRSCMFWARDGSSMQVYNQCCRTIHTFKFPCAQTIARSICMERMESPPLPQVKPPKHIRDQCRRLGGAIRITGLH